MQRAQPAILLTIALFLVTSSPLAALAAPASLGQPAAHLQGIPPASTAKPLDQAPVIDMPPVDNAALIKEEMERAGPGVAPRFAQPIPVDLTPVSSGAWETLADGTRLWRLRIHSAGAVSLNLGFGRYVMPEGGQLLLYTPDGSIVRGPFTAADNESHGQLWTPIVDGDVLVVEVRLPAAVASQLELRLTSVNHGFTEFGKALLSGSCNVDVVCNAADGYPQVDAWRSEIRSVAAISTGGGIFCTGFLVNNTAQDLKPYFMTANHCGITAGNAASLVTYWNYQNSTCRPPGSGASGGMGDGDLGQFNTGAVFRSASSASDFTLVELDDPINQAFNVHWAGWDATSANATTATAIHHPNGEEKRISFEDQATTTTSYLSTSSPGDGTHVRVIDWDLGTTEPGSSGSPLFSQDHRIVGQLHGGYAACGNNDSDWYGRISVSWNGGGTVATRLKDWLDPTNSGSLTLNGRDQTPDFSIDAAPATQDVCLPAGASYAITVASQTGFASAVTLSASGNPGVATFNPNPVTPPANGSTASTLTVSDFGAGSTTFSVVGASGALVRQDAVTLRAFVAAPDLVAATAPADGSTGQPTAPTFTWTSAVGAGSYDLQVARDPAFADLVVSASGLASTSYTPVAPLAFDTVYYWRVRAVNACGPSLWAPVWALRTGADGCTTYNSGDVPKPIADNTTVDSLLNVPDNFTISDVKVTLGRIDHTYDGDLDITIQHPDNTQVELSTDNGSSGDNFINTVFDDEASTSITAGSAPFTGSYRPEGSLAALDGKSASGAWKLSVADDANVDTGTLQAWSLTVCGSVASTLADYSDLAASYGIATHAGDGELRLGPAWTADASFAAGADNASDDGVAFVGAFAAGQPTTARVTVQGTPASGRWLQFWFDWNGDGVFASAEQVVDASVSPGDNDLVIAVPQGPAAPVAYRARLFDSASAPADGGPYGGAAGGEVEDGQTPAPCAAPDVPGHAAIASIGGNQVQVTWDAAQGADHYEVWYAVNTPYFAPGPDCANPAPHSCAVETTTSFTHLALGDPANHHIYAVRAVSACGAASALAQPRLGEFEFHLAPGD